MKQKFSLCGLVLLLIIIYLRKLPTRRLAEEQNIIIKSADKGSYVVVRDRDYWLAEADRQLKNNETYEMKAVLLRR